jgi:hypothetical protein
MGRAAALYVSIPMFSRGKNARERKQQEEWRKIHTELHTS